TKKNKKKKKKNTNINSLLKDKKNARKKLDKYKKQLHLLPTINDLKQSKEELKKLPKESNFPESGIERLEKNKEALVPLLSNHANIEKNISIYQNKLEEYKNAILTEEVYDLAHELLDERSHYEHNLAQSEELRKEIEQSNADINMTLNDLAIPLNKEALKDVNLPYYLTKTWK